MKQYKKDRAWPFEDPQISRELRQARRLFQQERHQAADTGAPLSQFPVLWRKSR